MTKWRVNERKIPGEIRVIVPGLEVPELILSDIHITEYGQRFLPIAGGASIGNVVEAKVLDHLVANATYTAPTPSLGLWTSAVDDTSTAATAGELTYT